MMMLRSVPDVFEQTVEKKLLILWTRRIHSSDGIPLVETALPTKNLPE